MQHRAEGSEGNPSRVVAQRTSLLERADLHRGSVHRAALFSGSHGSLAPGYSRRTNHTEDAAAWLTVLDSFPITPLQLHPCAGSATWLIAEQLNISAYDAGYIAVAKACGLELRSRYEKVVKRAPKLGVTVEP
jgi:predicted nucleic acid-binding protein